MSASFLAGMCFHCFAFPIVQTVDNILQVIPDAQCCCVLCVSCWLDDDMPDRQPRLLLCRIPYVREASLLAATLPSAVRVHAS